MEARLIVAILIACAVSQIEGQIQYFNGTITTKGCTSTKLCITSPSSCDPQGNSSCYFASSQLDPLNSSVIFELSGPAYLTTIIGLSPNKTQGYPLMIGMNNTNGNLSLLAFQYTNNTVFLYTQSDTQTIVNSVQGSLLTASQNITQAVLNISASSLVSFINNKTSSTKANNLNLNYYVGIFVFQGNLPVTIYESPYLLNLIDPKSNLNTTTAAPATTNAMTLATTKSGGVSIVALGSHVLAILLSILTIHVLC